MLLSTQKNKNTGLICNVLDTCSASLCEATVEELKTKNVNSIPMLNALQERKSNCVFDLLCSRINSQISTVLPRYKALSASNDNKLADHMLEYIFSNMKRELVTMGYAQNTQDCAITMDLWFQNKAIRNKKFSIALKSLNLLCHFTVHKEKFSVNFVKYAMFTPVNIPSSAPTITASITKLNGSASWLYFLNDTYLPLDAFLKYYFSSINLLDREADIYYSEIKGCIVAKCIGSFGKEYFTEIRVVKSDLEVVPRLKFASARYYDFANSGVDASYSPSVVANLKHILHVERDEEKWYEDYEII